MRQAGRFLYEIRTLYIKQPAPATMAAPPLTRRRIGTPSRSQLDTVVKYILSQEEHHKKKSFRLEYLEMLRKNEIEFCVRDNGNGFVETNEIRNKLGMRLIGIFSRQLKGEFKFENENGLKYVLVFKYN